MSTRYAADTRVSVESSQNELTRLLKKHGATAHAFGVENRIARVMFEINSRRVRFELKAPHYTEFGDEVPPQVKRQGPVRSQEWCERQADQAERQRWRALVLVCKAKLELIAEGMGTIETEFMANIVLPNNQLLGDWIAPQLADVYANKKMPPMLSGAKK